MSRRSGSVGGVGGNSHPDPALERPLAAFGLLGLGAGSSQKAGLDIGTGLLSLENGDLVAQVLDGLFEALDAVLLDTNNGEQTLDERGALFSPDVGKLHLHTAECRKTSPDQLRENPGLLRSYGKTLGKAGHGATSSREYTFGYADDSTTSDA
jgi:hypothetical protein